MSMISMGDLAQSYLLRRQNYSVKADLQRLTTEVTTGQRVDVTAHVQGDLAPLVGIDTALARLKGYGAVTADAGLFANAMQSALGLLDSVAVDLSSSAMTASAGIADTRIDTLGIDAQHKLETVMAALNTRVGDRSVFAGVQTDGAAIGDPESLLSALDTAVAGATSAADVEAAVSGWFDAPGGYAATIYQGGGPLVPLAVAQGEEVDLAVTANDPAVRETLKGLAMAALLNRGVLAGQPAARQDLVKRAGAKLLATASDRAEVSARLGMTQAQIDAAAARNSSETSAMQLARNDVVGADPYETASRLEETRAQLEKIYAITARMSRLTLLDYM